MFTLLLYTFVRRAKDQGRRSRRDSYRR